MSYAVCPSSGRRIPRVAPGDHMQSRLTPRRCKVLLYRSSPACTMLPEGEQRNLTEPSVLNGSWQIRFSIKLWLLGSFKILLLPWYYCYKQYCTANASPIIMTLAIRRTANKQVFHLHWIIFLSDLRKQKEKRHAHLTFFSLPFDLRGSSHPFLAPHPGQP